MSKLIGWIEILFLGIAVRVKRFWLWIKDVFLYYGNPSFRRADLMLISHYFFNNPYHLSRRFAEVTGEKSLYTYGETPLRTLEMIAHKCGLREQDLVVELGSGRGRTCFFLNAFFGCQTIGIEYIPHFVAIAEMIKKKCKLKHVDFVCSDMLEADYSKVDFVYLYGTCLDDFYIKRLTRCLTQLKKGAKVVTVSYALTDYLPNAPFVVKESVSMPFLWGEAEVFIQERKEFRREGSEDLL